MVGFLSARELFDDNYDPNTNFLIGGGDSSSALFREASAQINSFSPVLDKDFLDLPAFDTISVNKNVNLLLGDTTIKWDLPVLYLGAGITAPNLTRSLKEAYDIGVVPYKNSVWYVGACNYSAQDRDWARLNQRLLPEAEVSLEVGIKSALDEIGSTTPYHLMLNLDIINSVWAQAAKEPTFLGVYPRELWKALRAVTGTNVQVVQVCGINADHPNVMPTARLAAEFARDLSLMAFSERFGI